MRGWQVSAQKVCGHTPPPRAVPIPRLTCVWLVAAVSLAEVLGVLDDRDAGHADDHCIGPCVQRRGCGDAMVDVVQGAG